jgi:hypothetical protein
MRERRDARVAGVLLSALLAVGCGTTDSGIPSAAARVSGEDGVASKRDASPKRPIAPLDFRVDHLSANEIPVPLTVSGTLIYGGARVGTAVLTLNAAEAFNALAVGHTYRFDEIQ